MVDGGRRTGWWAVPLLEVTTKVVKYSQPHGWECVAVNNSGCVGWQAPEVCCAMLGGKVLVSAVSRCQRMRDELEGEVDVV